MRAAHFLHHPDPLTRQVAAAYAQGAFLMDNGDGLQFYTAPRRALVPLGERLHVPRRLERDLRHFELRINTRFDAVLAGCMARDETWISPELQEIYLHLHGTGLAHSYESWQGGQLAGGVLGLALGGAFMGETMFSAVTGGSKAALVGLSRHLTHQGFALLDAQLMNPHLRQFGTYEVSERAYGRQLAAALELDVGLNP